MAKISLTDIIYATLRLNGTIAATLRLNGVSSFAEILSRLLKALPTAGAKAFGRGLASVEIRNGSQGWATRRNVLLPAM